MARVEDADDAGLYDVADEVRDRCLRRADSLAAPGREIWTADHLAVLAEAPLELDAFDVLRPEAVCRALEPFDEAVARLAAEVLYLHLLAADPDEYDPERGRESVEAALERTSHDVTWPDRFLAALSGGFEGVELALEGGETWTHSFWVCWGRALHGLEDAERAELLADPWQLRNHVRRIPGEPDRPVRHAALHLLKPDVFEPIWSDATKTRIADAFRTYVPLDDGEPLDRQLLELRHWLHSERGIAIDAFDDERVRWFWADDSRWADFLEWIAFFYENWDRFDDEERNYKLEVARLGEPLREAVLEDEFTWIEQLEPFFEADANNLVDWRTAGSFRAWCREDSETAREGLAALWGSGAVGERIRAFCERLDEQVGSGPGTRLRLASALLMVESPTRYPPYQQRAIEGACELADYPAPTQDDAAARYEHALDLFDQIRTDLEVLGVDLRDRLDVQGLVWTLARRELDELDFLYQPEKGDFAEFRGTSIDEPADPAPREASIESFAERLGFTSSAFRETADHLHAKGQIVLYGPPGTGKTYYARRFAIWWMAVQNQRVPEVARELSGEARPGSGLSRATDLSDQLLSVTFHPSYAYEDFVEGFRPTREGDASNQLRLEDGLFKHFCQRASQSPDDSFLLLIDEINRANLPKVFGELLTVLERDKRGTPVRLPQSRESLVVPENLYLLGTMNTVDRSLRHLDAALRRRFRFLEMMPEPEMLEGTEIHGLDLGDCLRQLNERIVRREGRDKQIGHTYLLDDRGEPIASPETFARTFRYEIVPLLQEYCYDDFRRLEVYLGPEIVDTKRRAFHDDVLDSPERLADALRDHLLQS